MEQITHIYTHTYDMHESNGLGMSVNNKNDDFLLVKKTKKNIIVKYDFRKHTTRANLML